jgi:hypothetical protein
VSHRISRLHEYRPCHPHEERLQGDFRTFQEEINHCKLWVLPSAILVGKVSGVRVDLVPDDLWERLAPLLPPAPERRRRRHPGRLRLPDRTALAGHVCAADRCRLA